MGSLPPLLDKIGIVQKKATLLEMSDTSQEVLLWVARVKDHIDKCANQFMDELVNIHQQEKEKLLQLDHNFEMCKDKLTIHASDDSARKNIHDYFLESFRFVANESLMNISKDDLGSVSVSRFSAEINQELSNQSADNSSSALHVSKPSIEPNIDYSSVLNPPELRRPLLKSVPSTTQASSIRHFQKGSCVFARWAGDGMWYRAQVLDLVQVGYQVTFMDYGNKDFVSEDSVVGSREEIPVHDLTNVDAYVGTAVSSVKCGGRDDKRTSNQNLDRNNIVASSIDVRPTIEPNLVQSSKNPPLLRRPCLKFAPSSKLVDVNSSKHEGSNSKKCAHRNIVNEASSTKITVPSLTNHQHSVIGSNSAIQRESEQTKVILEFSVGELCMVKKEGEWLHAKIHKKVNKITYVVRYLHNEEFDLVKRSQILRNAKDVPENENCEGLSVNVLDDEVKSVATDLANVLKCILCGEIRKRCMRLVCDGSVVCWGCAVKAFTLDHNCWRCPAKKVYTSTHLQKDECLRLAIENYFSSDYDCANKFLSRSTTSFVPNQPRSPEVKHEVPDMKYFVGDQVVARWSEDLVWYNAQVLEVLQGKLRLLFSDYMNVDVVEEVYIEKNPQDIPDGERVDDNVSIPE